MDGERAPIETGLLLMTRRMRRIWEETKEEVTKTERDLCRGRAAEQAWAANWMICEKAAESAGERSWTDLGGDSQQEAGEADRQADRAMHRHARALAGLGVLLAWHEQAKRTERGKAEEFLYHLWVLLLAGSGSSAESLRRWRRTHSNSI